jgi:MFS family permease
VSRRFLVAIIGGVAGVLLGLVLEYVTGWRWWIRIGAALGPAAAILIAERKRLVRTPDELNRPETLFPKDER